MSMMKARGFLILTLLIAFQQLNAQKLIEGYVKYVPRCNDPRAVVMVFQDGEQIDEIFVETSNPYRFSKQVNNADIGSIELKISVESPDGYYIEPSYKGRYFSPPKRIKVKRLEDIGFEQIQKAREAFFAEDFDEVENVLTNTLSLDYPFKNSQKRYMIKILADAYNKMGQEEKGIELIEREILAKEMSNGSSQKFEDYSFLSSMYFKVGDYDSQKEVLNKLEEEVNLNLIPAKKRNLFYKAKYDNLLKVAGYNDFRTYPALEFSRLIATDSSKVSIDEWRKTAKNLFGVLGLAFDSKSEELSPSTILEQVTTINAKLEEMQ